MKKTTCRRRRRRVKTQLPEGSLLPVWRCSHLQVLQRRLGKRRWGRWREKGGKGNRGMKKKKRTKRMNTKKRAKMITKKKKMGRIQDGRRERIGGIKPFD